MAEELQSGAGESNDVDMKEWDDASVDFQSEKGIDPAEPVKPVEAKPEEAKPDPEAPAKPAEDPEAKPEPPKPPENETEEEKTAREAKEAEEAQKPEVQDNPAVRETRAVQREAQAEREAVAADVKEKMFSDVKDELTDSDGDPIRTIADVQKRINPLTGKAFTPEEATIYLFEAQKHLEKVQKETTQQIEKITEVNISLKDQADNIRIKYGDLLKNMPVLAEELRADFAETLEKDEKTGTIVNAPVSLERFYERALRPYADHLSKIEADEKAESDAKAKAAAATNRRQTQSDRSDVFSGGKSETRSPEEKEWAAVAEDYYEG